MGRGGRVEPPGLELPERALRALREREWFEERFFWGGFVEHFDATGREPREYWDFRIGHVLPGIGPDDVGSLRPVELMDALLFFNARYLEE